MNKYIAFFNGEQIEVNADSLYKAKLQAVEIFKPAKSKKHTVHAHLAEKDGEEIMHTPDF